MLDLLSPKTCSSIIVLCLLTTCTDVSISARPRAHAIKRTVRSAMTSPASETLQVLIDGKTRKSIRLETINAIRYCPLRKLNMSEPGGSAQDPGALIMEDHAIRTEGSSFFVMA